MTNRRKRANDASSGTLVRPERKPARARDAETRETEAGEGRDETPAKAEPTRAVTPAEAVAEHQRRMHEPHATQSGVVVDGRALPRNPVEIVRPRRSWR